MTIGIITWITIINARAITSITSIVTLYATSIIRFIIAIGTAAYWINKDSMVRRKTRNARIEAEIITENIKIEIKIKF